MSSKFTSLVSGHDPVPTDSCRRGPEWSVVPTDARLFLAASLTFLRIPSIIWQFTWAWLFAPFILWKIRHIHDIHHWRRQTTVCLIAAYVCPVPTMNITHSAKATGLTIMAGVTILLVTGVGSHQQILGSAPLVRPINPRG